MIVQNMGNMQYGILPHVFLLMHFCKSNNNFIKKLLFILINLRIFVLKFYHYPICSGDDLTITKKYN